MDFNTHWSIFAVQLYILFSTGNLFLYASEPYAEPEQTLLNLGAQNKE